MAGGGAEGAALEEVEKVLTKPGVRRAGQNRWDSPAAYTEGALS